MTLFSHVSLYHSVKGAAYDKREPLWTGAPLYCCRR